LTDFLNSGPPPVFVGLGSMNNTDPERLTDIVLRALERTGRRGILATGWGGIGDPDLPDSVFRVEEVPHDWLLERVASLRAGVPTAVVPFFADQPFWGRRIAELGVGPEPIPRRSLSVDRLANAIQQATADRAMKARAIALGRRIKEEKGIERAVDAFDLHTTKAS
jgi:sterol 3beta-glucosyltransferase